MHTDQLALFSDRIAVDKNFTPTAKNVDGEMQWTMDFQASFGLPREQINDILIFLLKKIYDNPLAEEIAFTIKELANFHEKTAQIYNKLTIVDIPDKDNSGTYTNNLEIILYRLATRNLQLTRSYVVPKKDKKDKEVTNELKPLQVITNFKKSMLNGKTKMYSVILNPLIVKNLSSFFFFTSHHDYKKISNKSRKATSWKLYLLKLNNLFNNLSYGNTKYQPTFSELVYILSLSPTAKASEHKRSISSTTTELLSLESLKGLKFKWIKSGNQRYPYTPHFHIDEDLLKSNKMIEDDKAKFIRMDIYLIAELRELKIPLQREDLAENTSFILKALESSYMTIMQRTPTSEEVNSFFKKGLYKNKFESALKKIMI